MRGVCDIETDGLISKGKYPSKIHIIVFKNIDTGELHVFDTPEKLKQFPLFASKVKTWIGHNFIGFDMMVLNKLLGTDIKWQQVIDTLVLSRLFNHVVKRRAVDKKTQEIYTFSCLKRKVHSLDYWATQVGVEKIANDEWLEMSDTIVQRCINDVEINHAVYNALLEEGKTFSKDSVRLEHHITYLTTLQSIGGFAFNVPEAKKLYAKVCKEWQDIRDAIEQEACAIFKPKYVKRLRTVKDGSIHKADANFVKAYPYKKKIDRLNWIIFERIDFNIDSPSQIVAHLNKAGWNPTVLTKAGNPKICEENLNTLSPEAPKVYHLFKEYNELNARKGNLEEWFAALGDDNKVHGSVITVGAKTHRMAHRNPNTGNIASGKSRYGKECRQLWTVEDTSKYSLLGTDASGIQLRILAHYINDPEYTKGVLVDPHTTHQNILSLPTRSLAKTWMYAWLFGAGALKLGSILGGGTAEGKASAKLFEERVPGLKQLKKQMELAGKRGFVPSLNGGRIPAESARCLPAFLQGGEQIVMKLARCLWETQARKLGYDYSVGADVHDEWQAQVNNNLTVDEFCVKFNSEKEAEAYADPRGRILSKPVPILITDPDTGAGEYKFFYNKLGELQVLALREAGKRLGLNCPIDGEYQIGLTWNETH